MTRIQTIGHYDAGPVQRRLRELLSERLAKEYAESKRVREYCDALDLQLGPDK